MARQAGKFDVRREMFLDADSITIDDTGSPDDLVVIPIADAEAVLLALCGEIGDPCLRVVRFATPPVASEEGA